MLKMNYKNTDTDRFSSNVVAGDHKNSMEINWDLTINILVIGSIILFFISKFTGQTIGELFRGIRDFILDTKEEVQDKGEDLIYYE